ncbi:MAG TPA: hypothetical protein VFA58_07810 [Chthoniobacterales bacterium]|nr:hypothetical protein [Chthoniobacterales bacterium]
MQHWKLILPGAVAALAILAAPFASAQSSGNFTSQITTTQCTINTVGGLPNSGSLNGGSPHNILDTYIKTSNGSGTTLLITPSLVTGLFTNTEVTQGMESSAVSAAVKVAVTLDGAPVAPATTATPSIIYDQRFQQLSTNVFDRIVTCSVTNDCSIDLVESTLAAHSFNFVAPNVPVGNHHVQVTWSFECSDNTGAMVPCTEFYTANTAGACAGPGSVTVTQTKAFSQSGGVTVGP